jgi:hypothetical protein
MLGVELNESSFGERHKGKYSRCVAGNVVIFGVLKRQGRGHTIVVDNAKPETLLSAIKKKIMPDNIVIYR